jgi:antitoxin CcdA
MRINYAHSRKAMKKRPSRDIQERPQRGGRIAQTTPGRKRAVNVTVDEGVLAEAKDLRLNLSHILEDELRKRVTEEKTRRWQEEHREAIDAHNRFIEKHGIFGAKSRSW